MRERLDLLLLTDEVALPLSDGADVLRRFTPRQDMTQRAYQGANISAREADKVEQEHGARLYMTLREGARAIAFPHRPSLALADLATVSAERGYRVQVIDNFLRWPSRLAQVERVCRDTPPTLIGVSTTFMFDADAVRRTIRMLRERSPTSEIALGGPTVRRLAELHGCADFAVFGSGEDAIVELLDALAGKRSVESIPRIAFRGEDGGIRYGPESDTAALLGRSGEPYRALEGEHIPIPDWTLYRRSPAQVYPIEFSRGCKYNCYYCSYDRGKNIRDLGEVRRELLANARLGITKYRVSDSNFTDGPPADPRYPQTVCETMIQLDLGLQWSCFARVDDMTPELADLMRRAGCYCVFFGVESGDDGVLKLMRKGHDSADAARGIQIAREAGLRSHANFMVGYPGDSLAANEKTLEFIERNQPDSVTIMQYFAEEMTPAMGPRMKQFRLRGAGRNWEHATMDSATAAEIVHGNVQKMLAAGITIGSEFEVAAHMSFGLSLEETLQHQCDINTLQADQNAGYDEKREAAARIRELMLCRFPHAVMEDRRAMGLN